MTVTPDGQWRLTDNRDQEIMAGNVRIIRGRQLIKERVKPLSDDRFLIEISNRCQYALDALRTGDAAEAFREGVKIGRALREFEIRRDALAHAKRGRDVKDGSQKGHKDKAKDYAEKFDEAYEIILRHYNPPESSWSRACEIAAEKMKELYPDPNDWTPAANTLRNRFRSPKK